jgi:hypothetical protein
MKDQAAKVLASTPTARALTDGPSLGRVSDRSAERPDADALLVALTLSPATYSRNRFFEMYRSPEVQRARRRAGHLRNVVTALVSAEGAKGAARLLSLDENEEGGAMLIYEVASVGMRRTVRLRPIELSLLRYCVGRARGESAQAALQPRPGDRERISLALQGLSRIVVSGAPPLDT